MVSTRKRVGFGGRKWWRNGVEMVDWWLFLVGLVMKMVMSCVGKKASREWVWWLPVGAPASFCQRK